MSQERPPLEAIELLRYGRHISIPEVGEDGQQRLKAGRVLLVGLGGLGSPVAMYLAAAGVGTLGLVEPDRVELSNLQRQILYGEAELGARKLEAARTRLAGINPHVQLETHPVRFGLHNAIELVESYDVVVDGSDNFPTRYLVNDACVRVGRPDVFGAISRFEGQLSVFWAERGPCYRCLFPEPPPAGTVPSCAEAGVFGVLPGIVGSLQAAEVLKILLGIGEPLVGRLLVFDALAPRFREVALGKAEACPVCSRDPASIELVDYEESCEAPEPRTLSGEISPAQLRRWLDEGRSLTLVDVRLPYEHAICRIDEAELLPLPELPHRLDELRGRPDLVMMCHHGIRSAYAQRFLREAGFEGVLNLTGGIEAWRRDVDPSMPRY